MKTLDLCLEGAAGRDLWGTLTLPENPSAPPIVMAHGFLGFKDWAFFPWLAQTFAAQGFPVFRFNFSGSGMGPQTEGPFIEPEAFQADTPTRQVEDLRTVLTALAKGKLEPELPASPKVLLWGHSRGGGICLLASFGHPAVAGIATWATISRVNRYLYEVKQIWRRQGAMVYESSRTGQTLSYGLGFLEDAEKWGKEGDIPTYLHNLSVPVFLLHGSEDTSVPPDESESLAAVHRQARLAIIAGADHKFNSSHPFAGPAPVLEEAAKKTLDFYMGIVG